ncbi:putative bifunctional diguanylate cyclase/phosphodiesterase [Inhella gelatinilytica]|uniref:Bifunctional diguanylate cyclase/phosphodiesterase n=1 Tax=Inhella gelatinilytica TaxID=2795030 RepID=A0A931IUR5_9BURK|nr:bifunctional diguanylate cyclase/phosphodiesterase [Inhella gelatinilytica]MBH9551906.1 bifunctional diguanylate cyclase/phosphodiesterase [Inhella gelatinilytica]
MSRALASAPPPSTAPPGGPEQPHATRRYAIRAQRVRAVSLLSAGALCASAVGTALHSSLLTVALLLLATAGALVAYGLSRRGHSDVAVTVLMGSLTGAFSLLMWVNRGLADPAISTFPAILLFAAQLGNRRLFGGLLLIMVLNVVGVGMADLLGWVQRAPRPVNWSLILDHVLLLTASGFAVWWISRDLHRAVRDADAETLRVKDSLAHIEYLSRHDGVTELGNRLLAQERFSTAAAHARRHGQQVALLYFDLDHFKLVNDTLGHPVGDQMLRSVAHRVNAVVRETDTVCRFGGDEFLVLLPALDSGDQASRVAGQIVEVLSQPFELQGQSMVCGCSLGVVIYPQDAEDFDELVKRADLAMYRVKEEGRNGFHFFDPSLHARVEHQMALDAALRDALARNEGLHLAYQPQFDLRTGALVGWEALLRWQHPTLGALSPAEFIPIAERSGLILALGQWVLRAACQQAQAWRARGWPAVRMSVNVSPLQMRRSDFLPSVDAALAACGLPADALELEITEGVLMQDDSPAAASLTALGERGIALAIDDFGTGYSNLGYLSRFQVHRLKIDRSFVHNLSQSPQDLALVRAIVHMAHGLGLVTVAEGVETDAQQQQLQALGCDHGQGWLWHPALRPAECEAIWEQAQAQAPSHPSSPPFRPA